eukprot:366014-Chlamydomonas_euryale.AAC.15
MEGSTARLAACPACTPVGVGPIGATVRTAWPGGSPRVGVEGCHVCHAPCAHVDVDGRRAKQEWVIRIRAEPAVCEGAPITFWATTRSQKACERQMSVRRQSHHRFKLRSSTGKSYHRSYVAGWRAKPLPKDLALPVNSLI